MQVFAPRNCLSTELTFFMQHGKMEVNDREDEAREFITKVNGKC